MHNTEILCYMSSRGTIDVHIDYSCSRHGTYLYEFTRHLFDIRERPWICVVQAGAADDSHRSVIQFLWLNKAWDAEYWFITQFAEDILGGLPEWPVPGNAIKLYRGTILEVLAEQYTPKETDCGR